MGTSKSFPTPSGGAWTPVKNDITDSLSGDKRVTPDKIIGGTLRAVGGLGLPSPGARSSSSGGPRNHAGAGGGGRGRTGGGHTSIGRTTSRLGGFGAAFQQSGLDGALGALGLEELKGRPAVEVISRIADHLAEDTNPLESDILSDALKAALIEAAALEDSGEYGDLEDALQAFFDKNGAEGLIQLFLTNYVFDRLWMAVENHAQLKSSNGNGSDALGIAVGQACRSHVESLIQDAKTTGRFNQIDWFGRGGIQLGNELVSELEGRLKAL